MEAHVSINDEYIWEAVEGYVNDVMDAKLLEYIHSDDLECDIESFIDDKELLTADMVCDVTEFEARVNECEAAINKLCDRSIEKKAKINDISGQMLKDGEVIWAAIKDLQFNHDRWSGENYALRQHVSVLQEQVDYLYNKVHDLESRTLRGRWDAVTTWVKEKFRG